MRSKTRKPAVGARPGTLAIDPQAPKPHLCVISYDEDTVEEHDSVGLADLGELPVSGRKLWVDVQGLGDEQLLRGLAEIFAVHPLALEDVVHIPVRPKVEPYDENLLIVTRILQMGKEDDLNVEQVSLLIGKDYVLSFQERYGDVLDPVRQRLQVDHSRMRELPSDYLGYAILDTIVDSYYPVLEIMGDRIEGLEKRVLDEASPETLQELNTIRGQLLSLRRVISPQREAVKALLRVEDELVSDPVRVYFRDTYDHVVQLSEAVEQARELVSGVMNTYLTVVSNRMNDVMKTLTIVASIFVPLTFIAGIYGMNFERMPELGLRWAYPASLGIMALVAGGMVFYFWRKGWIGRRGG
jgi:magnesium transporter